MSEKSGFRLIFVIGSEETIFNILNRLEPKEITGLSETGAVLLKVRNPVFTAIVGEDWKLDFITQYSGPLAPPVVTFESSNSEIVSGVVVPEENRIDLSVTVGTALIRVVATLSNLERAEVSFPLRIVSMDG